MAEPGQAVTMNGHVNGSENVVVSGDLIVMTPIKQGSTQNIIRVERIPRIEAANEILHIGGGAHTGIIIRKPGSVSPANDEDETMDATDLQLEFTVFLVDAESQTHKQENRQLKFWFRDGIDHEKKHYVVQEFFKTLLTQFPKDYVGFIKRLLKMFQTGFPNLRKVELNLATVEEPIVNMPSTKDYTETGSEVECVTSGHVQDVLEHAYPNGLSTDAIATALRCTQEEVYAFLDELESKGLVRNLEGGEWLRVEADHDLDQALSRQIPRSATRGADEGGPTVAIVTALFVEKLAIDAMIQDKQTYMRYKTDGESNVYTIGRIGNHKVVATKLSAVGHSRAAMIAAGSITTRLLGGFQGVEHVLVVGVGGGVPHYTDANRHVRLGDVVVSTPPLEGTKYSYVYCDKIERHRITNEVQGYAVKTWNPKDGVIENVVNDLITESIDERTGWQAELVEPQTSLETAYPTDYHFGRPDPSTDTLTLPLGDGDVATVAHPDEGRTWPKLHSGPIGAGRAVLKDPGVRAEFAQRFHLKAYDGDFDSVVESVFGNRVESWALVRGIADYGDGMRNKEWQANAALNAAAVARSIICRLPETTL